MGLVNFLGNEVVAGGLITALAGIAFLAWEYLRLEPGGRWAVHALAARRIAVTLTLAAVILMASRFVYVVSVNGGV